jgi:hypothetical protein
MGKVVKRRDAKVLKHLCRLSSAKTCDVELLVAPLLAALQAGYMAEVEEIASIDGLLQRLTAAHVKDLLLAMLQAGNSPGLFTEVAEVPAAQQLPLGSLKTLFEAAVQLQERWLFVLIQSLPAQAAQLQFVDVVAAVQVAVQLQDAGAVQQCLALPAACDLEPDQLRQLLVAVVQLDSNSHVLPGPVGALCSMQNMQHLSHEMIEDVLQAAFDTSCRNWVVLHWLVPVMCQLPQAHRMQLSKVQEWLQLSLAQPAQPVTAALCSWMERSAAQPGDGPGPRFGSREAEGLLVSAAPVGVGGSLLGLEAVCSLKCVKCAAGARTVARVLNRVVGFIVAFGAEDQCTAAAIQLLLQLPAAVSMPAPEVAQLLASWLPRCNHSDQLHSSTPAVTLLQVLCSMPAMVHFSCEMIQDVLSTAFHSQHRVWSVLQWLVPQMCQLPQAYRMQLSSILGWLQLALKLPAHEVRAALCSCLEQHAAHPSIDSAVASFGSREAEDLLLSALPTGMRGSLSGLEAVCILECVKRMAHAKILAQVVGRALSFRSGVLCSNPAAATRLLLQLPAAANIAAPEVAHLISGVLQECSDDTLVEELIQELNGSGSLLGPDDLVSLMQTCLLQRSDECAATCILLLCIGPAAEQISDSAAQELQLNAAEMQQPQALAICSTSAAVRQLQSPV